MENAHLPSIASSDSAALQQLLVSPEQLAKLLGVSRAHIFRMSSSGRLPRCIRFGRTVRWSVATINAWLAAGAPPRDRWEEMQNTNHTTRHANR